MKNVKDNRVRHALLPLGMGLLVMGLIFGLNIDQIFLGFIPIGLIFLVISFVKIMKERSK